MKNILPRSWYCQRNWWDSDINTRLVLLAHSKHSSSAVYTMERENNIERQTCRSTCAREWLPSVRRSTQHIQRHCTISVSVQTYQRPRPSKVLSWGSEAKTPTQSLVARSYFWSQFSSKFTQFVYSGNTHLPLVKLIATKHHGHSKQSKIDNIMFLFVFRWITSASVQPEPLGVLRTHFRRIFWKKNRGKFCYSSCVVVQTSWVTAV